MANSTVAFGFRPHKPLNPARLMSYIALSSYATDMFIGDCVKMGGTGDYVTGYASCVLAAAGDANVIGVITGIEPMSPDNLLVPYGKASTSRLVKVLPATQDQLFEILADAQMAITDLGNGFDYVATAGSTVTGLSAFALHVASAATTGVALRTHGFVDRPDIDHSAAGLGLVVIVSFAESIWNNGAGA